MIVGSRGHPNIVVISAKAKEELFEKVSQLQNIKEVHRLVIPDRCQAALHEHNGFVYRSWVADCGDTAGMTRYDCAVELKDNNETST